MNPCTIFITAVEEFSLEILMDSNKFFNLRILLCNRPLSCKSKFFFTVLFWNSVDLNPLFYPATHPFFFLCLYPYLRYTQTHT